MKGQSDSRRDSLRGASWSVRIYIYRLYLQVCVCVVDLNLFDRLFQFLRYRLQKFRSIFVDNSATCDVFD